ncbi:hypothetical protein N6H18_16265 [Reichenbachiella agarivorans]|uniref:Outer membrane protein beta-barrel domain-containing protein n=1 Tax=Reichenbachiella agarivorans TaxID=2979464 RepID=A0ABY6CN12_9BACT|nr:hypothetical protein [Reichenbachiella agarivorans]UXP31901.1 hypothetical protein N6H18_16265 [Reichenbachiella agarivorans]
MKNLFLLTILGLLALKSQAQVDAQLNIVNFMLFEASGSVEKAINNRVSIGGFAGYYYGLPEDNSDILPVFNGNGGENKYFYVGPEIKFYVLPKDKIDRFYIGAYARYLGGKATSPDTEEYINGNYVPIEVSSTYNKVAFGFSIGSKWVLPSNIMFGVHGGLDRNIVSIYENNDYLDHTLGGDDNENFGYRIGISLGYRFN